MQPPEHDPIEQMLTDLATREPSRMLDERIAQTLQDGFQSVEPQQGIKMLWVRTFAVAASVAVVGLIVWAVFFNTQAPSPDVPPMVEAKPVDPIPTPPADTAGPSILTEGHYARPYDFTWSRDISEQHRHTPSGQPYRAVVREAVQQRAWHNPETGETLQFNIPSRELIVIKQSTF